MEAKSIFKKSGAPTARSMAKSMAIHVLVLAVLMVIPAQALFRSVPPNKELDIVFYHPPEIPVNARAVSPMPRGVSAAGSPPGAPASALKPKPNAPAGPDLAGKAELPPGPEVGLPVEAKPKVGNAGILAFKDKFASLAQDTVVAPLGADARHVAVDDVGRPSARSLLTSNTPGSSGGINVASLSRSVGGGGGGSGGGGNGGGGVSGRGAGGAGGIGGVGTGRVVSTIAPITGADRPKARGGPGPARTDEEIQIVFDRYKASFYRLYNRELRNNPALKGQMVLRLTIEPDGSVSMCMLQSTDMDAPDLATQVVGRVKTINFGAKDVAAVTIVYPIDFLPAA
ncbi:MAG TPA: AgmX/PglI C-terminal domain-containing protein [Candidatus Acidoferrum sp.]|nr:AgmX/PglI C-terminal domain-containing protein [Candidatus Acidoferrum sp.]